MFSMKPSVRALLVLPFLAALASPAFAQWAVNGNPVCTATGVQQDVASTTDRNGGSILVWQDKRTDASGDIYTRRIDSYGAGMWGTNGMPICTASGTQQLQQVAQDGVGYVFWLWEDQRAGNKDVYCAVGDLNGNVYTPANGRAVGSGGGDQSTPVLAAAEELDLAYAAWTDTRDGNSDIYFQCFHTTEFGPANGAAVCTQPSLQSGPGVCPRYPLDNGAIVAWQDYRNGASDVYAQAVDLYGNAQWTTDGVPVCTAAGAQTNVMIVRDEAGGAIIAWKDQRNGGSIYAQHIDANGTPLWPAGGVLVIAAPTITVPKMVVDGGGGAILAWPDYRNSGTTGEDIFAQRIDGDGNLRWTAGGVPVCTAAGDQASVALAPNRTGAAIVTWQDLRSSPQFDLYAQYLYDLYPNVQAWTTNGILICNATLNQFNPAISYSPTDGTCVISWQDERTGGSGIYDLYAQRIDVYNNGKIGHPRPTILSADDRTNDEGGYVRIQWKAGDNAGSGPTYQLVYADDYPDASYSGPVSGGPTYTTDVPSWQDGVASSYVLTVACPGGSFTSNAMIATSYDNLAPAAPTLTGARSGYNVNLSWNASAGDVQTYTVVRTDAGTIAAPTSPGYTDSAVPYGQLTYRVRATDIHGNVGPWSNDLVIPTALAVDGGPPPPSVLALRPNAPNPFTGSTAIHFGLPASTPVRLEVYDVRGARAATRDLGTLAAGWRTVTFDGTDDAGRRLPCGVYEYRLATAGQHCTGRMVIAR